MHAINSVETLNATLWRHPTPRGALLALVLLHLMHNVLLSPMGTAASEASSWWHVMVWIGILYSQPTLLAIWGALSLERLASRLPRAAAVACLLSLAMTLGTRFNQSGVLEPYDLASAALPLCHFIVLFCALVMVRRWRQWQISTANATDGIADADRIRFSLFDILSWTSGAAVALAAGLYLFNNYAPAPPGGPIFLSWSVLGTALVGGITSGLFSIPVVLNVLAVLSNRLHLLRFFWVVLSFGVQTLVVAVIVKLSGQQIADSLPHFVVVLLSFQIATSLTLLVFRGFGFRLRRHCPKPLDSQNAAAH